MSEMIKSKNDLFRGQKVPKPKRPKIIYDAEGIGIYTCPHCGKVADIEACDVMGAEPDCVFCEHCSGEFEL
jgi:hypothetical protein